MSSPSTSTSTMQLTKGMKHFEPDNSWIEKWQLENSIKQNEFVLGTERVDLSNSRTKANWDPEKRQAIVTENVGKTLESFGRTIQGKTILESEETLYLLESNLLELFYYDVRVSIQQAYSMIINEEDLPLEIYRAYATLLNRGFRLLRNNDLNNIAQSLSDSDTDIDLENLEFPYSNVDLTESQKEFLNSSFHVDSNEVSIVSQELDSNSDFENIINKENNLSKLSDAILNEDEINKTSSSHANDKNKIDPSHDLDISVNMDISVNEISQEKMDSPEIQIEDNPIELEKEKDTRNFDINSMIVLDSLTSDNENQLNFNNSIDPTSMDIDQMIIVDEISTEHNESSFNDISKEKVINQSTTNQLNINQNSEKTKDSPDNEDIILKYRDIKTNPSQSSNNLSKDDFHDDQFIIVDSIESDDESMNEKSTENSNNKGETDLLVLKEKNREGTFREVIQEILLDSLDGTENTKKDQDEDITIIEEINISENDEDDDNDADDDEEDEGDEDDDDDDDDDEENDDDIEDLDENILNEDKNSEDNDILDINLRDQDRILNEPMTDPPAEIEVLTIPRREVPLINLESDDDDDSIIEDFSNLSNNKENSIEVVNLSSDESEDEIVNLVPSNWKPLPKLPQKQKRSSEEIMDSWKSNFTKEKDIILKEIITGPFNQKTVNFPDQQCLPDSFKNVSNKVRNISWSMVTSKSTEAKPAKVFTFHEPYWSPPWVEHNVRPLERRKPFNRLPPLQIPPNQNPNCSYWFQYGNFFQNSIKPESPHQFFKTENIKLEQPNILKKNGKKWKKRKAKSNKNDVPHPKRIKTEPIKTEPCSNNNSSSNNNPSSIEPNNIHQTTNFPSNNLPNLNMICDNSNAQAFNVNPPAFTSTTPNKPFYKKMFSIYSPGKPFRKSQPGPPDGHLIFTRGETRPEETLNKLELSNGNIPLVLSVYHDHSLSFFSVKRSHLVPWTPNDTLN